MDIWKYYDGDLKYPDLNKHSHEKEIAKTNIKWAFDYVSKHGKDEDLEPIIAKSTYHSFWYAKLVLKGPFKLGEPAISKSTEYSYQYATDILKGPFPLGEPAIAKNAYYAVLYAEHILHDRFELAEPEIAKSASYEIGRASCRERVLRLV